MGTHGNKLNATECIHSSSFLDIRSVNEKSHVSAFGIGRSPNRFCVDNLRFDIHCLISSANRPMSCQRSTTFKFSPNARSLSRTKIVVGAPPILGRLGPAKYTKVDTV